MANLNLLNNPIIGPAGLINNNTLNNNPVIDIARGVKLGNNPIGNPGFISGEQLVTFFVGNAVGLTKQALYNIAIKNTELLSQNTNFSGSPTSEPNGPFIEPQALSPNRLLTTSEFGTPIFDYVKLLPCSYYQFQAVPTTTAQRLSNIDTKTTAKPIKYDFDGVEFITCMVDVTRAIDIVETKTVGSIQGTIKEYTGSSEWNINLTSYITTNINDRIDYNVDVVSQLKLIPEINTPIPVDSYFLNLLGITHVVPTNLTIRPVENMVGVLQVEMTLLSDSEIIGKA